MTDETMSLKDLLGRPDADLYDGFAAQRFKELEVAA
jgi:hypothetical protein